MSSLLTSVTIKTTPLESIKEETIISSLLLRQIKIVDVDESLWSDEVLRTSMRVDKESLHTIAETKPSMKLYENYLVLYPSEIDDVPEEYLTQELADNVFNRNMSIYSYLPNHLKSLEASKEIIKTSIEFYDDLPDEYKCRVQARILDSDSDTESSSSDSISTISSSDSNLTEITYIQEDTDESSLSKHFIEVAHPAISDIVSHNAEVQKMLLINNILSSAILLVLLIVLSLLIILW